MRDEIGPFDIARITHVRVDGDWVEVVVGSVRPCEIRWPATSAGAEGHAERGLAFHALSLPARGLLRTGFRYVDDRSYFEPIRLAD